MELKFCRLWDASEIKSQFGAALPRLYRALNVNQTRSRLSCEPLVPCHQDRLLANICGQVCRIKK